MPMAVVTIVGLCSTSDVMTFEILQLFCQKAPGVNGLKLSFIPGFLFKKQK